ncbi:hypothetical protein [Kutzneria sp. CA-103260]|uniref:hypothetical protein n=1 Tax=Kutzneria sp. CA-103260 TaxID=2802641 RepID=UPI001BAD82AC|nr:hypothetical protein [Kutzneria sp. CA-103260]QUQ64297.1 hypothetical protein JJ691_20170 [Kutzneria sp. CA-103260]
MTSSADDRGEISFADALAAITRLGASSREDIAEVLDLLGLIAPSPASRYDMAEERPFARTAPPEPSGDALWSPSDDGAEPEPDPVLGPFQPFIGEATVEPARQPDWLDLLPALAVPTQAVLENPVPPPVDPMLVRASMIDLVTVDGQRRVLDVRGVVDCLAQARAIDPLPLLAPRRPASLVQILVDHGEGMQPYQHDVAFFIDRLLEVVGPDGSELHTFVGTPLLGIDPDPFTGASRDWRPPGLGALVVVIGVQSRFNPVEWQAVARTVADHGGWLVVLSPSALPDTPLMRVVRWDDLNDPGGRHGRP